MKATGNQNGSPFDHDDDQFPFLTGNPVAGPFADISPTIVLYGSDVSASVVSHAGGAAGGSSGDGGGGAVVSGGAGSGLIINVSYDTSVANAPSGFKTVVSDVVQYFQTHFLDPVTVNIAVGYGEVGGSRLPAGALGTSSTYLASFGYSTLVNALTSDAKTSADSSSIASLAATDPTGGHYWVSTAEGKALGLLGPSASIDGYVGFSSASGIFDYNNGDGVNPGSYDFYGVVAHEFSEVMGRMLLVGASIGGNANSYVPLDLFHYSSPGVHVYSGTTAGYFSANGGTTHINTFNTVVGGDFGDWAGDSLDAYNAYGSPGVVEPISTGDQSALDVIGWDAGTATPLPDLTAGTLHVTMSGGQPSLSFSVNNIGTLAAGSSSTAAVYLSTDAVISSADKLIGTAGIGDLAAGTSTSASVTLPSLSLLTPPVAAGIYYLGVAADSANAVAEASETNNTAALKVILGNDSANTLSGTSAADTIVGFGGVDTITGGVGADTLVGGASADHFVFQSKGDGTDELLDFIHGVDVLDFASAAFGKHMAVGGGNTGTLDLKYFVANETGPTNTFQEFWFKPSSSMLYYDANGSAAGAPVAMAHLAGVSTLTTSDIHLI